MGQCYELNKIHIYAWIAKNKDKRNEYSKKWQKLKYVPLKIYGYEREAKRLRNISF